MSFEIKHMSKEEKMTAEEMQQYFERLCQMDEEELRKLFEASDIYITLKKLTEKWAATKDKKHINNDLISRRELIYGIGEDTLFPYLTAEDIREHKLYTDEDGQFYFTEDQANIAGVMYNLMRRYINDFPGVESRKNIKELFADFDGEYVPVEE